MPALGPSYQLSSTQWTPPRLTCRKRWEGNFRTFAVFSAFCWRSEAPGGCSGECMWTIRAPSCPGASSTWATLGFLAFSTADQYDPQLAKEVTDEHQWWTLKASWALFSEMLPMVFSLSNAYAILCCDLFAWGKCLNFCWLASFNQLLWHFKSWKQLHSQNRKSRKEKWIYCDKAPASAPLPAASPEARASSGSWKYTKFCIGLKITKSRCRTTSRLQFGYSKWFLSAALYGVIWEWVDQ